MKEWLDFKACRDKILIIKKRTDVLYLLWATCGQPNWVVGVALGGGKSLNKQMLKPQYLDNTFIPHQKLRADIDNSISAFLISTLCISIDKS